MDKLTKLTNPRCRKAGFSASAASLLEVADFWWAKARVNRQGRVWLVFTKAQWCEHTGLSDWQNRIAFRELRDCGVFETKVFRWKQAPTTFVAINYDRFLWLETHPKTTEIKQPRDKARAYKSAMSLGLPGAVSPDTPGAVSPDHTYLKESKNSKRKKYQEGSCSLRFTEPLSANDNGEAVAEDQSWEPSLSALEVPPENLGDQAVNTQEVKAKLEASIAERMANAKAPPSNTGSKIGQLHEQWRILTSTADNHVSPQMPGSAIASLKILVKLAPEGTAPAILAAVAQNWQEFTDILCAKHGAFKLPKTPALWVIAKFTNQAITLWQQQKLAVTKAAEKLVAVQLIAQAEASKPKLDPELLEKWTQEEFEALYAENVPGGRKPGDEANYNFRKQTHTPTIRKKIQWAWDDAQRNGTVYEGPRPVAKAA